MAFLYYTLFSIAIVVLDQVTKYLTVANIELFADIPFIPGLLQLTYVRNTGSAFSSFEGYIAEFVCKNINGTPLGMSWWSARCRYCPNPIAWMPLPTQYKDGNKE